MTDEEREDLNTFRHDLVKQARWWQWKAETLEKENEQIKAENAALRERLEKAVELPFVPTDYHIETWLAEIKVSLTDESAKIIVPVYIYQKFDNVEAAFVRLAELKGE